MRLRPRSGFSLIEMIVLVGIAAIIVGTVTFMHVSNMRIFARTQADASILTRKAVIIREFGSVIHNSSMVVPSVSVTSGSYASASDTAIFALPGIDADDEAIDGVTDYAIFYLDPVDSEAFRMEIVPGTGSVRPSRTLQLADGVISLEFLYDDDVPSAAGVVSLILEFSAPYRGQTVVSNLEYSHALGSI